MSGLGMWPKEDMGNVLAGIASAAPFMGSERCPNEAAAFQAGFLAALSSVALSFGIADYAAPTRTVRLVGCGVGRLQIQERP